MKILELLLAFLRIGVGEGEEPPPQSADEPPPEDADDLQIDEPGDETPPEDPEPEDPKVQLTAAQKAAKDEKERADRYERELTEARRSQPQPRTEQQEFITPEEKQRLADPKTTDVEKWQIESNRILRQNTASANLALAQAQDTRDQATFATLAQTKPAVYKKYAARVEETLATMRSKGFNAPRETILKNLIGDDVMNGKLTRKAKSPEVPRGKLPGARSDVRSGSNGMTEHQKRAKRLENVAI